jgi:hypothetical protein
VTAAPESRSPRGVLRHAGLLVWIAFFLVPRATGGIVNGIPAGPIEAAALLAIAWLAARRRRLSGAAGVAVALVASLAIALSVPDRGGFEARYYATTDATGAFERSTEFRDRPFTRIDRSLHFEPDRAEFPLAFFNDLGRFNFYQPHEPKREQMAFSASWDGHWYVETDASPRELYLDAPRASAHILLDGVPVVSAAPLDDAHFAVVRPERGWHTLQVRLVSPEGSPRRLSAGERVGDRRLPFASPDVSSARAEAWQLAAAPVARTVATAIDGAVLAWLGVLLVLGTRDAWRAIIAQRPSWTLSGDVLTLLALGAFVEALVFATPWTWRMMTLVGGDDTLTYESYARQIQLDSLLLAHGGGEPFFYQVLYPYALAAMHAVFGESMFGPMLIQRLLLALLAWSIVRIARSIGGRDASWAAVIGGAAFAYGLMAPISAKLLNESFFVPLLAAWVAATLDASASPSWPSIVRAGLLGGVTTLTRSTALPAWIIAAALCWWAWRAVPRRAQLVAAMIACSCVVMSFIGVRNWIVVHDVILMPGELPVTLYGGNEPPPGLSIAEEPQRAIYNWLGLHPFTRQVVEYAITAPAPFFGNLTNKALFALGYFDLYAPGWGYSIGLLAISISSVAGLVIVRRYPAAPVWVALFPALVALTQYLAVVIVYPKGMRLILPFHALMMPYASVALNAVWRRVLRA